MINEGLDLGQLITLLQGQPADDGLIFDFGGTRPTSLSSYRGYYEDLAVGFSDEGAATVGDFLAVLKAAVGESFYGYKGGSYRMSERSTVWVANPSYTSDTFIKGIRACSYMTVLETGWEST